MCIILCMSVHTYVLIMYVCMYVCKQITYMYVCMYRTITKDKDEDFAHFRDPLLELATT